MRYSQFIHGIDLAEITLDRKSLSNLAIEDPGAFAKIVELSRNAVKLHSETATKL